MVHHLNDKNWWQVLERQHIVLSTYSFFDGTLVSLNFGYVFIACSNVELGMEIGQFAAHGFELVICKDDGDLESTCHICTNDGFEVLEDVTILHGVELTS